MLKKNSPEMSSLRISRNVKKSSYEGTGFFLKTAINELPKTPFSSLVAF
jgi:hypothetical protein